MKPYPLQKLYVEHQAVLWIENARSLNDLKNNILNFIRSTENNIFGCHNLKGIKYLARLRLGFSQLYEHNFKLNFQDLLNPLCTCDCSIENTCHFLLSFSSSPNFLTEKNTLHNKIINIDSNFLNLVDATIAKTLLFGNSKYYNKVSLFWMQVSTLF